LEVVKLRPLRVHSPVYEHGLVPFTETFSDQLSGPLFICGTPLQIKEPQSQRGPWAKPSVHPGRYCPTDGRQLP
jgi:hypothetical protein